MSRLATQCAAIAFASSVVAFFFGLMVGDPVLIGVFVLAAVGLSLWVWRARRGDQTEGPWPADPSAAPSVLARPHRGSTGQVARALGHVEGREVALSPWSAVGVGFCAVIVVAFASSYDDGETWGSIVQDLPFLAHPFVGMMVLVGHRLGTRPERDGARELFASCPTTDRTRTIGVLGAAWVPVAALALFFAAYLLVVEVSVPSGTAGTAGAAGAALALMLLAGMLLGAGGLVLGVALARWVSNPLAPVLAVVLVGLASPKLGSGPAGEMSTVMVLSTMPGISEGAPLLTTGQAVFHVLWLLAITAATAAVALLGTRHDAALTRLPAGDAPLGSEPEPAS